MKVTNLKNMALTFGALMTSGVMAMDESELPIGIKHNSDLNPVLSNKALVDGSAGPTSTSIRYKNFAASGMKPINGPQTYDYSYSGGGCMKAVAPTDYLGIDEVIDLPIGSKIVSMTLLANPSSSTDSLRAILFAADAANNFAFSNVATVIISDDSIPSYTEQGMFLDYTLLYNTVLTARLEQSGNTGEVCGVRIGYISYDVADDVIFSTNFFR